MKDHFQIKKILSTKTATAVIILLAVANRIIQLVFFYNIHFDPSYQVIATENLLSGHGLTISKAMTSDLANTFYEPLIMWPPGYTFLLAPFYVLFNHNYIAAGITADILFALLLIFTCRSILKLLEVENYLINLFSLFTGFFIYFFYFMASSDAIAITCFAVAILYSLKIYRDQKIKATRFLILTIALSAAALLKYMYMPVALVIPCFLLLTGIIDRKTFAIKTGVFSLLITGLAIASTLIYQDSISGQAAYISAPGRGFYPEHLSETHPFIPASFFNPASITSLTADPSLEGLVLFLFKIVNIIVLVFLILFFLKHITKTRFQHLSLRQSFFYTGFLLSMAIILLLAFLSVRVEKETILPGILWTYVQEVRYYGLITILLHLSIFILFQSYSTNHRFIKYLLAFVILLMLPEFFRGIAFTIKRMGNMGREEYSWQWDNRFQQFADSIITEEKKKDQPSNIIVAGPSYWLNQRVSIYSNAAALHEAEKLNNLAALKTTKPVLLLAIIDSIESKKFKPFLADSTKQFAGQFDRFYFYILHVRPNTP